MPKKIKNLFLYQRRISITKRRNVFFILNSPLQGHHFGVGGAGSALCFEVEPKKTAWYCEKGQKGWRIIGRSFSLLLLCFSRWKKNYVIDQISKRHNWGVGYKKGISKEMLFFVKHLYVSLIPSPIIVPNMKSMCFF